MTENPENPYEQFALADPDDGDYPLQAVAWREGAVSGVGSACARIAYESMEVDFEICGGCGTIIDIDAESCGCEYPPRGKTKTFYIISSEALNEISHG